MIPLVPAIPRTPRASPRWQFSPQVRRGVWRSDPCRREADLHGTADGVAGIGVERENERRIAWVRDVKGKGEGWTESCRGAWWGASPGMGLRGQE